MPEEIIIHQQHHEELLSQEVNELIGYRPSWIIRKGNGILLLIVLLLLSLTWLVKYPDIIKASVRLVAVNAPKLLTARTEGRLDSLLIKNEQEVEAGQALAFIESTASHQQVLALRKWISETELSVASNNLNVLLKKPFPALNELGEIQSSYQEFQHILNETIQILANGYYQQKKKDLLQDLQYLSAMQQNALRQQRLLEQELALQQTEYKVKEKLAKEKVIVPLELNQDKSKLIIKEHGIQQASSQLINNNMLGHNKKKEILDLQKFTIDQQLKFVAALFNLKSRVEEWIQRYVVIAPISGKVLFVTFLQEEQFLIPSQELFYVQPPQSQYYGELMAGQNGLGKIKKDQKVIIRVESYPSSEFGYVNGKVSYISDIPTQRDSFLIKVELPEGLSTNYGEKVFFRNNLSASAEIITDDRRLFHRFLGQLKNAARR